MPPIRPKCRLECVVHAAHIQYPLPATTIQDELIFVCPKFHRWRLYYRNRAQEKESSDPLASPALFQSGANSQRDQGRVGNRTVSSKSTISPLLGGSCPRMTF